MPDEQEHTIAALMLDKLQEHPVEIIADYIQHIHNVFGEQIKIFNSAIPFSTKLAECNDGKNIYSNSTLHV